MSLQSAMTCAQLYKDINIYMYVCMSEYVFTHTQTQIPAARLMPSNPRKLFSFVSKGVIITTEDSY